MVFKASQLQYKQSFFFILEETSLLKPIYKKYIFGKKKIKKYKIKKKIQNKKKKLT